MSTAEAVATQARKQLVLTRVARYTPWILSGAAIVFALLWVLVLAQPCGDTGCTGTQTNFGSAVHDPQDFLAYYRRLRTRFLVHIESSTATYPYPVEYCSLCSFLDACTRAEIDAQLSSNIRLAIWEKFVVLVAMSAATTAIRLPIGPIRENARTRMEFLELVKLRGGSAVIPTPVDGALACVND